jgi:hypothetical protein
MALRLPPSLGPSVVRRLATRLRVQIKFDFQHRYEMKPDGERK